MTIRTFQPGDEAAQVRIYNEACGELPRFKPATLDEVRRRTAAAEFDPGTRFYALADGETVGYATFHANGRVSYPWCRKGHERWAEPLFDAILNAMRQRGHAGAFAAYRADWTGPLEFFRTHGFTKSRDMVNFVCDLPDVRAVASQPWEVPVKPEDLPALARQAPQGLRTTTAAELQRYYFQNRYFPATSLFALRQGKDGTSPEIGLVIVNPAYAHPKQLDAAMPCFRLGAFGTEGMQTKRVNGLFSFLAAGPDVESSGLELLSHAVARLRNAGVDCLAAQAPSDAPGLLHFYERHFQKQGSFPVLERAL
jgi:hypothetical protein